MDLYREFTPEEVAALTGVNKKEQDKALESLETVVQSDEVNIRVDEDAVPVEITLLLMPEANRDYEIAMHRAVGIAAKATPWSIRIEPITPARWPRPWTCPARRRAMPPSPRSWLAS